MQFAIFNEINQKKMIFKNLKYKNCFINLKIPYLMNKCHEFIKKNYTYTLPFSCHVCNLCFIYQYQRSASKWV